MTEHELETSVPTDLTISSFSDDEVQKWKYKTSVNSNAKKNYAKEIQLLKLELIQKNSLVLSLKNELAAKKKNFDERLKDASHQKKMAETVLKTKFTFIEENLRRELNDVKSKLQKMKQLNGTLEEDIQDLKFNLHNINGSGADDLSTQSRKTLTDFVVSKINEREEDLKKERDSALLEISRLQTLLCELKGSHQSCQEELQKQQTDYLHIKEKYERLSFERDEAVSRVHRSTYAQENFHRIKLERDQLHNEVLDLKKVNDSLKAELSLVIQTKDDAKQEVSKLKQTIALLQRECETASEQLSDVMQRWGESEDKISKLRAELDQSKSSREDLIERFMRTKDQQRFEFEERLIFEKRQLNLESKVIHEQEIRSLTEAKNSLLREKQSLEIENSELKKKYKQLQLEYDEKRDKEVDLLKTLHRDEVDRENKIKVTEKSLNLLEMKYEEKCKDHDKANTKLQFVEKELEDVKKSFYEKSLRLETELGVSKSRLEILEKMEDEMNALVDEAAQMHDPDIDEQLGNIVLQLPPASAKLSFIQNITLTRKMAELERKLHSVHRELEAEKEKNSSLRQQAQQNSQLLSQVKQPYSYLIENIRENEKSIQHLTLKMKRKQEELELTSKKNVELESQKSLLMNDLEVLLKNRQDMTKLSEEIQRLKSIKPSSAIQPSQTKQKLKKTASIAK